MNRFLIIVLFLTSIFCFVACEDDEQIVSYEEDSIAEGIIFYSFGRIIADIYKGETTDILSAFVGNRNTPLNVKFYDSDKNIIEPPDDNDISFRWEISNDDILELFNDSRGETKYGFHFIGKKIGTTEIEFFLLKENRNIFSSGKIPVIVEK